MHLWTSISLLVGRRVRPDRGGTKKIPHRWEEESRPVGNGIHDYPWSAKLLKVMLDNSNVAERVRVEYHLDGWPHDEQTLEDADAIMVISDGRDGDRFERRPFFVTRPHATDCPQMRRGCGFYVSFFDIRAGCIREEILDWSGGYFDWETDGKRKWYSAITTKAADVVPATPGHPILRGVGRFFPAEEFYYNIRFKPSDRALVPIGRSALHGRTKRGMSSHGLGRGRMRVGASARRAATFTTTGKHDNFRRMILNAIVWAAKVDVPASVSRPDSTRTQRSLRHLPASREPSGLSSTIGPAALSDGSKKALVNFIAGRGGPILIHFANGAFHS